MPELPLASQYLTNTKFDRIINHMMWSGVRIDHEDRIAGITYFQSGDNLNTLQVVIMDANIPTIVTKHLKSVGGKLRKEFVDSSNTHSHATVMTEKDFLKLSPKWKRRVARDYQNRLVFVKLVGVVALSRGDEMFLGLKVEMHEYNELRVEAGLDPIETPHITTTFMWRRVYEKCLKPAVGRRFGQVDIYWEDWEDWSQRSEARTEDWIERSSQGQVDRSERRMKQDGLNKERVEA